MSLSVSFASTVTVSETLPGNHPFATDQKSVVTHDQFNTGQTLTGASTPPATKLAAFQKALSSGAATIDLTALTGTNGATVDLTGLKLQVVKFRNPGTNANPITIAVGASNGYDLGGAAFSVTLSPGDEWTYKGISTSPVVGSGARTFDLTGTLAQALDCLIVAG